MTTLPPDFIAWTSGLSLADQQLIAAYAPVARARQQVDEKLSSGGTFGLYSPYFVALKAEAAKFPALDAQMRARGLYDKFWSYGVRTGLIEALVRDWGPMVLAAATVATIGYSGVLSSSTYGLSGTQIFSAPAADAVSTVATTASTASTVASTASTVSTISAALAPVIDTAIGVAGSVVTAVATKKLIGDTAPPAPVARERAVAPVSAPASNTGIFALLAAGLAAIFFL